MPKRGAQASTLVSAGSKAAESGLLPSFGEHLRGQLIRNAVRLPLNATIGQQDLDEALKDTIRLTVADTVGGWAAYNIGQASYNGLIDSVTHKIWHGLAGGATGAIFNPNDPIKGAMSGAAANMMAETVAELMGRDSNFILSTADTARLSTALAAHLMNLDVNTAIHTSTLAVENNFCLGFTITPKKNATINDLYDLPDELEMTPEQKQDFRTKLDRKVEECQAYVGQPLSREQYEILKDCAVQKFIDDGPGEASAYALVNALKIPGTLVQEGLTLSNLTTPETASAIAKGVDRFVFFISLAYGPSAGASYMRTFTSGVAPKIGKNLAPGLTVTGANVEQRSAQLAPVDYTTPEAPFTFRIDPITGRGPMAIDTRDFTSAKSYTTEGAKRNHLQFWKMWNEKYPGTLSESNLFIISVNKKSPIVDNQWLLHFPEHQNYLGNTLIHHHIEHGHLATALPKFLHEQPPGRFIFHTDLGGRRK